MIKSSEFITLIDARCNLAIQADSKYRRMEAKISELLKKIDKEIAKELDEVLSEQQAIVEELIYKQGMKDALTLIK